MVIPQTCSRQFEFSQSLNFDSAELSYKKCAGGFHYSILTYGASGERSEQLGKTSFSLKLNSKQQELNTGLVLVIESVMSGLKVNSTSVTLTEQAIMID